MEKTIQQLIQEIKDALPIADKQGISFPKAMCWCSWDHLSHYDGPDTPQARTNFYTNQSLFARNLMSWREHLFVAHKALEELQSKQAITPAELALGIVTAMMESPYIFTDDSGEILHNPEKLQEIVEQQFREHFLV
jgi:hypothetical protein